MRVVVLATSAIVATAAGACGWRTELSGDQCDVVGAERECGTACGQGRQACDGEKWGACEVPRATRSCRDLCGQGVQACEAGEWGACVVAPVSLPCSAACGRGTLTCSEGVAGECVPLVTRRSCSTVCGSGEEACVDGTWQRCDAPAPLPPTLPAIVRDFSDAHPDFELPVLGDNSDPGVVADILGDDGTPTYRGGLRTRTTSGAASFHQWFHDVPGVNARTEIDLVLTRDLETNQFVYSDAAFFPIDGRLLGNEGRAHNFHFTLQLHSQFDYAGGERFSFEGDDDVWVFVNRRLVVDLGGTHPSLFKAVELDAVAPGIGLVRGNRYDFDLFFAERRTNESHFTLRSSLALRETCP